jgi:cellobiose phosphorylase
VEWDSQRECVLARNPANNEFREQTVVVAARADGGEVYHSLDRLWFVGDGGTLARPRALENEPVLRYLRPTGGESAAILQLRLEIPPGGRVSVDFLMGAVDSTAQIDSLIGSSDGGAPAILERARGFWRNLTGRLRIETPAPELDLMVNGWLAYQNLSCRLMGRTAFYQSGGAYGYRDQLQDASAMVYLDPGLLRRQIVLHAEHQFAEGDVLHWWHPPTSKGIRTRFSDDLLWLPYITAFYTRTTGDTAVLDEQARFLTARQLEPGEDEAFVYPRDTGEEVSIYEHCCHILDRSLTRGRNGLPLMGTGDWNDGMNRVGREGKGESVWLGFFIYHIINRFIPICEARGDTERMNRYRSYREQLYTALNEAGWDGEWYRRAFYDNGNVIGSKQSDECRIDALAQAWAVMSKAAPHERREMALDAMERYLVDEEAGIIRLLTPAFDKTPDDPGYIKGYVPGVRENGGQYTHAALWAVRALAEAGRGDRATRLLSMLSPVSHSLTKEDADRYHVEPYVIAADVYGEPPHVGRGGWTWYTGSAGWMYRVALESILGIRLEGGTHLLVNPCIPAEWGGFTVTYRVPRLETTYALRVSNESGMTRGVRGAWCNGDALEIIGGAACIPLSGDGQRHEVIIQM